MEVTRQIETDAEPQAGVDRHDPQYERQYVCRCCSSAHPTNPHERVAALLSDGDVESAAEALETLERLLLAWGRKEVTIGFGHSWFVTIELERYGCIAFGHTLPDAFRSLSTGGDGVRENHEIGDSVPCA